MIYTRLISGLGNQLFQYAIGRQVSLLNKAPLKLDISFFASQSLRSYKLDVYNTKAELATQVEVETLLERYSSQSLSAKVLRRLDSHLPKRYRRLFRESEWWIYEPELFQTTSPVYLDGYWQHYKYFENLDPLIRDELTLKNSYPTGAQAIRQAIERDKGAVAVHVRRGDYITDTNANAFMGVIPISYYQQAMAYITARVPNVHFYFFSDEPAWVRQHLLSGSNMSVVEVENGTDYLDLDLMSKCAHNIIANSSFSWWGAFLNRNPDKLIVAPRQWVVPNEVNQKIELVPPSWVKL